MSNKTTMKVGFIGFIYTPPEQITDPVEYIEWQIQAAARLGCAILHVSAPIPEDARSLNRLKESLTRSSIELEISAPHDVYALSATGAKDARIAITNRIKTAQFLGTNILRNGYGRLTTETSRFNKKIPPKQHLQLLIDNLKEAARIFEDEGMYLAVENHCDFTGREFVEVFDAVGSKHVGAALDTANGYTVYCDPNEDVELLAPYALTTHIKDMKVVDYPSNGRFIPYQAFGCPLGEGNVDIGRAIELLDRHSPNSNGLHLVIEQGWLDYKEGIDKKTQDKLALEQSVEYLKSLLR